MDIKDLQEEDILSLLKRGETIPLYQDLSLNSSYRPASNVFSQVLSEEDKLHRALSRGISESKKFTGKTKTTDILKELSFDMGLDIPPDLKFEYTPGRAGQVDIDKNLLYLNPKSFSSLGKESIIAHELRHLKEKSLYNPYKDTSLRTGLYTEPQGPLDALSKWASLEKNIKKEQGKSLSYYNKMKARLFPDDKLKPSIDALAAYDFLEKGHFSKSFLKENLQRVAKGLPVIGTAATIAGGLGYSDAAGAATDILVPGGLEETAVSDERAISDPKYQEYIRRMSQRKK